MDLVVQVKFLPKEPNGKPGDNVEIIRELICPVALERRSVFRYLGVGWSYSRSGSDYCASTNNQHLNQFLYLLGTDYVHTGVAQL